MPRVNTEIFNATVDHGVGKFLADLSVYLRIDPQGNPNASKMFRMILDDYVARHQSQMGPALAKRYHEIRSRHLGA